MHVQAFCVDTMYNIIYKGITTYIVPLLYVASIQLHAPRFLFFFVDYYTQASEEESDMLIIFFYHVLY